MYSITSKSENKIIFRYQNPKTEKYEHLDKVSAGGMEKFQKHIIGGSAGKIIKYF